MFNSLFLIFYSLAQLTDSSRPENSRLENERRYRDRKKEMTDILIQVVDNLPHDIAGMTHTRMEWLQLGKQNKKRGTAFKLAAAAYALESVRHSLQATI
jgi:hypothetical protein